MSEDTFVFPKYMEKSADAYAAACTEEIEGIGNPQSEAYEKSFKKYKRQWCKDHHESLTGIRANPTTPKSGATFTEWNDELYSGGNSFIGKNAKNEDHGLAAKRILRGDLVSLAHTYLEYAGKLHVKQSTSLDGTFQRSDFEKKRTTGDDDTDKKNYQKAVRYCYKRAAILNALNAAINSVYAADFEALEEIIDSAISQIPDKEIDQTHMHQRFAGLLKNPLKQAYGQVDIKKIFSDSLGSADFLKGT